MSSSNKTKIIKIEFTPEQQDEINRINKGLPMPKTKIVTNKAGYSYEYTTNKKFSYETARKRLRQLYGGICVNCAAWPSYKVMYDKGDEKQGAWLVERYCQQCFDKWQERINK